MLQTPLYEVWMSHGDGIVLGPRFRRFEDARRYVLEHRKDASMAVRSPDGSWALIAPRPRRNWARGTRSPRIF
jgi:hypothetical protein